MAAVGDVYRVSMLGTLAPNLEPIINTLHYRISVAGAGDERTALLNAFEAVGGPHNILANILPSSLSWKFVTIQAVKPVGTLVYGVPSYTAGVVAGNYLPSQCAGVITKKTATPGKGGRGRLFVGPIPLTGQDSTDPDQVSATFYSSLTTVLLNVLTNGGWSFTPVLFKRRANLSLDLTSATSNRLIKTRRSRAEGTRFHRRRRHSIGVI